MITARRRFLQALAASAAGAAVISAPGRRALASAVAPLQVTALGGQLHLIAGAGGNVLALASKDGVLLVDGGLAERTPDLLKAVESFAGKRPITVLFNTHWHWDHTGANERLRKQGAKIIAHENTRLWLGTEIVSEWEHRTYPRRPAEAAPTETFYKSGTLTFGEEPIEYGYLGQAHTDGDIYVYFRRQNVLVAGDVLAVGSYPILDYSTGGWIGGMADAAQKLLDLSDDATRIVPGTGPVQSKSDLGAEQEMLASLREDLWQLMRKGFGAEDMIASGATRKYDAKWGKPDLFVTNAYRGLYGHVRELRGVV